MRVVASRSMSEASQRRSARDGAPGVHRVALLATYILAVTTAMIGWIYFLARLCVKFFELINA